MADKSANSLPPIPTSTKVITYIYIGILLVSTIYRNHTWSTPVSLWSDIVHKSPLKLRPHLFLGIAYEGVGNFVGAVQEYDAILKLCASGITGGGSDMVSYCSDADSNLASLLIQFNDLRGARAELVELLQADPSFNKAYINLGVIDLKMGKFQQALDELRKGDPDGKMLDVTFNKAEAYHMMNMCKEAYELYSKVKLWYPSLVIPHCWTDGGYKLYAVR